MDVHIPAPITSGLRRRGIDVLTAQEDGTRRMPDTAVLDRATEMGRMLFTYDSDFILESAKRQVAGVRFTSILYAAQRMSYRESIENVEFAALTFTPHDAMNQLWFLPLR
jgi:predicted nuclease of predicted toxin-antitoxin system